MRIRRTGVIRVRRENSGESALFNNFSLTPTVNFGPSSFSFYTLFFEVFSSLSNKSSRLNTSWAYTFPRFNLLTSSHYILRYRGKLSGTNLIISELAADIETQAALDEALDTGKPVQPQNTVIPEEDIDVDVLRREVNISTMPILDNSIVCPGVDFTNVSLGLLQSSSSEQCSLGFNNLLLPAELKFGLNLNLTSADYMSWVPAFKVNTHLMG